MRSVMAAAVLVSVALMAGCGSQVATQPARSSSTAPTTSTSSTTSSPRSSTASPLGSGRGDPAADLLALAPEPPGARPSGPLRGQHFASPALRPECTPLDVRTRYWTSTTSGSEVQSYLLAHYGPKLAVSGSGSGTTHGVVTYWTVTLQPTARPDRSFNDPLLVYAIARSGRATGIRVDAEVVPAGSKCSSAGGAAQH